MNNLLFQSGDKVLFIGDSITDCGRRDAHAPLGHGYVRKITELITAKYPERQITYVNKGIGGDIVEGLESRWDIDVIDEKPKWLSVKIGINNASRQYGEGVSTVDYLPIWEECYRRILTRAKTELGASLFLFEIFYIAEDVDTPRPLDVDAYNASIHRLAEEFDARLIPTSTAFESAVAARPGALWTTQDGVHPNAEGHTLMALEFLKQAAW
ncbi:MAG: SGNH/GDSL hydrolase family protein [Candidatus Poribacteria bacterium]|nr:SGNH/GDSL hydrolase family protein [Candidatus Poribacteria bacterium]